MLESEFRHKHIKWITNKVVLDALHQIHGHRLRAAQLLGVSERTLYRHIQRMRGR